MESSQPKTSNTSEVDETEDLLLNDTFIIIDDVKDESTENEDDAENNIPEKSENEEKISLKTEKEFVEDAEVVKESLTQTLKIKYEKDIILSGGTSNDVKLTEQIPLVILTNIDEESKIINEVKSNNNSEIDFTSDDVIDLRFEETFVPIIKIENNKQKSNKKNKSTEIKKTETLKTVTYKIPKKNKSPEITNITNINKTKDINKTKLETKTCNENKIGFDILPSSSRDQIGKKTIISRIKLLKRLILVEDVSFREKYQVIRDLTDTWRADRCDEVLRNEINLKYLGKRWGPREKRISDTKGSRDSSVEPDNNFEKNNKGKNAAATNTKDIKSNKDDKKRKTEKNNHDTKKVEDKKNNRSTLKSSSKKVRYEFKKKLEPSIKRPSVPSRGHERISNSHNTSNRTQYHYRNDSIIQIIPKLDRPFENTTSINKNSLSHQPAIFNNAQNLMPNPVLQQLSQALTSFNMSNIPQNHVQNVPQIKQPFIQQPFVQQPVYQQATSSKPVPLMQQTINKPFQTPFINREEPRMNMPNINPWINSPIIVERKQESNTNDDLFSRNKEHDRFETNHRNTFGNRSPDRDIYSKRDSSQIFNAFRKDAERIDTLKRKGSVSPPRFNKFARDDSSERNRFFQNMQRSSNENRTLENIDMYSRKDMFSNNENRRERSPDSFNSFSKRDLNSRIQPSSNENRTSENIDMYSRKAMFSNNENRRERSPDSFNSFSKRDLNSRIQPSSNENRTAGNIDMYSRKAMFSNNENRRERSPDNFISFSKSELNSRIQPFIDKNLWNNTHLQNKSPGFIYYPMSEGKSLKKPQITKNNQSNNLSHLYGQQVNMYQTPQNVQNTNFQSTMPAPQNNNPYNSGMQMPYLNYNTSLTTQPNPMPNFCGMNSVIYSNTNFSSMPTTMPNNTYNKPKNNKTNNKPKNKRKRYTTRKILK